MHVRPPTSSTASATSKPRWSAMGMLATALGDDARVEELRAVAERMRMLVDDTDDPSPTPSTSTRRPTSPSTTTTMARPCRRRPRVGRVRAGGRVGQVPPSAVEPGGRSRGPRPAPGVDHIAARNHRSRPRGERPSHRGEALVGPLCKRTSLDRGLRAITGSGCARPTRRLGGPELTALGNAAEFAVETGEWAKADELLADLQSRSGLPDNLADAVLLDSALLAAYRGDHTAAQLALDSVREHMEASTNPTVVAWYRRVRSVLLLTSGDLTRRLRRGDRRRRPRGGDRAQQHGGCRVRRARGLLAARPGAGAAGARPDAARGQALARSRAAAGWRPASTRSRAGPARPPPPTTACWPAASPPATRSPTP